MVGAEGMPCAHPDVAVERRLDKHLRALGLVGVPGVLDLAPRRALDREPQRLASLAVRHARQELDVRLAEERVRVEEREEVDVEGGVPNAEFGRGDVLPHLLRVDAPAQEIQ